MDSLAFYLRSLKRYPLLFRREDYESWFLIFSKTNNKRQRQQAHDQIICGTADLVISIAKKYLRHGVPLEDLAQEGFCGLERAIEKFDLQRGIGFRSYAYWWIEDAIRTAAYTQNTDWPQFFPFKKRRLRFSCLSALRLDDQCGREHDGGSFAANLCVHGRPFTEQESAALLFGIDYRRTLRLITGNLSKVSARQALALELRYGLNASEVLLTLEQVAVKMSVSRERARQLIADGMKKLSGLINLPLNDVVAALETKKESMQCEAA